MAMCGYTVQRNTQSVPFVAYGLLFVVVHEATYLRAKRDSDREIPLQGAQRRTTHHVAIVIFHNQFVYIYIYIYMYRYIVRTIYIYIIYIYISPWNPIKSPWIRFLNLGFCSPIVPPSSWGGQVAKGCESGVASKYAQTRTTLVHPSLKFPWNSKRLLRLADEASTKQKLILLSAVQQLVSSPHPTSLSKNWDEYRKNTISIPSPYCWKWWVALVFFGLGSLRFSMGPIEK